MMKHLILEMNLHLKGNIIMKTKLISSLFILTVFLTGCSSVFTKFDEVAVDKVYIPKQCPTFVHEFEITGSKFRLGDTSQLNNVLMKLDDLTFSLSANTVARNTFNETIIEENKETFVRDDSDSENRVEKRIFVNRECPKYYYVPEFSAKKLIDGFIPEDGVIYVVIPLSNMVFEMEKHKKSKQIFNNRVDDINSK